MEATDKRWNDCIEDFLLYLRIDRSLSKHSSDAYRRDVRKLASYASRLTPPVPPEQMDLETMRHFLKEISGLAAASQARTVSGLRAFYHYLLLEDRVEKNPVDQLSLPKLSRKLPQVPSFQEIEAIEQSFDLSVPENFRNKTMIEMMYSCGLRVSEVVNLRLSDLHLKEGFIRVVGKGDKQRIIPIGSYASKLLRLHIRGRRARQKAKKGQEDFVFLNRNGHALTREMVFQVVKKAVEDAGIRKNISPHSFRHAFATHLVEGGADLRSVQEMLGHKNITTTEIYTHLDRHFLEETIRNFHPRYKKHTDS